MEKNNDIKLTIKNQFIVEFSKEIPIKDFINILNEFPYNVKLISCEKRSETNFRTKYKLIFERQETSNE